MDRSVNFGWNSGPVYQEVLGVLYQMEKRIPAISFIGGLAGADITIINFKDTIMTTKKALNGNLQESTIWINE